MSLESFKELNVNQIFLDDTWGELEVYSRPMDRMSLAAGSVLMEKSECYDIDIEADVIDVTDTVTVVWEIK